MKVLVIDGGSRLFGAALESVLMLEVTYALPPQPAIDALSGRRGKGEKKRAAKQRRLRGGF